MKHITPKQIQNLTLCSLSVFAMSLTSLSADSISVNFHVGDDSDAQSDHILTTGEFAGSGTYGLITDQWNNIDVGAGGNNATAATIFAPTALLDNSGASSGATLATSAASTWFVGYSASSAAAANELGLVGNDDDLFNSYLALNGPSGDGSPADTAILTLSGLGSAFTSGGYNLIIYVDTDKGPVNSDRQSVFTLTPSGSGKISQFAEDDNGAGGNDATFDGTYILTDGVDNGSDYANTVVFSGLNADSFTLELTSPGSGGRAGISGFQLVTVPEPSSYALISGILVFVGIIMRRRR